jgi:8-oxo-dGTP pyrophosphatase MutT (NUDIX family)
MGLTRRAARMISRYPPLYAFLLKIISKVPFLDAYFIKSSDKFSHKFPVSVKGVVLRDNCVVLLKNERDEWELPGGKLEPSEVLEACVVREIYEELKLEVKVSTLLDAWMYAPLKGTSILIVTFGCIETAFRDVELSSEHKQLAWFPVSTIGELNMPEGYKSSVHHWFRITVTKSTSETDL